VSQIVKRHHVRRQRRRVVSQELQLVANVHPTRLHLAPLAPRQ
jgi:hypothetical protein